MTQAENDFIRYCLAEADLQVLMLYISESVTQSVYRVQNMCLPSQHISDSEATTHLHEATTLVQQFIVYLARTLHACRDASARHLKSVCYQEPD